MTSCRFRSGEAFGRFRCSSATQKFVGEAAEIIHLGEASLRPSDMMRSLHERRGRCDVSAEENKPIIPRLVEEVYNQDRLNLLDELATQDVVNHPALTEYRHGIEGIGGFKHVNRWAHELFPDPYYAIEAKIFEGDMVAVRIACSGTRVAPTASGEINDRAL